jgi:hypothetical protein
VLAPWKPDHLTNWVHAYFPKRHLTITMAVLEIGHPVVGARCRCGSRQHGIAHAAKAMVPHTARDCKRRATVARAAAPTKAMLLLRKKKVVCDLAYS